LWFNKGHQTLEVFTNQGYVPVSGIIVSYTQPLISNPGNMWFNTSTNQLSLFDGTNWDLIGPTYTKAQGVSGAIPVVVNDKILIGVTHNLLQLQYGSLIIATFCADSFTPTGYDPGFPTINQGITINGNLTSSSININVTGNLTGNVVGNLTGNVVGNLTGSIVTATNLVGSLMGNVAGNVVGSSITAGNVSGNIVGINSSFVNTTTAVLNVANIQASSGNVINLTGLSAINGNVNNLTTSNLTILGGVLNNMSAITSNIITVSNIFVANVFSPAVNAGFLFAPIANIGNSVVGNEVITNLSVANAQISSGNVSVSSANATNANITNTITTKTITASTGIVSNVSSQNLYVTTINANLVQSPTIGNVGTVLVGTISASNPTQSNITGVGTISQGTWQGSVVGASYGGTGFNNGSYTLSIQNASQVLNQNVAISSSPTFGISNFTGTNTNLNVGVATKANVVTTAAGGFGILQIGSKLYFQFNGANIASLDSGGNLITANNITAFGTP
jgi:hypothetical protein